MTQVWDGRRKLTPKVVLWSVHVHIHACMCVYVNIHTHKLKFKLFRPHRDQPAIHPSNQQHHSKFYQTTELMKTIKYPQTWLGNELTCYVMISLKNGLANAIKLKCGSLNPATLLTERLLRTNESNGSQPGLMFSHPWEHLTLQLRLVVIPQNGDTTSTRCNGAGMLLNTTQGFLTTKNHLA